MAKIAINVGSTANDGTGDQLRTAFQSTNSNIDEIYGGTATVGNATVPANPHGVAGDLAGQVAYANGFLYVCILDYVNDTTVSWQRVAIAAQDATTW